MSYFERVDEATLAAWNQLAARLREDLAAAGFTLFDQASTTGVEVEVDPGNDPAGGIFVTWSVSPTLMERIHPAVARGDHDDPALHHFGVIQEAMVEALRVILVSAGHRVQPANDDYRPYALRVISISE